MEELWLANKKAEMDAWRLHQNPSLIQYIIIHHSLSADGAEHNWEAIRRFHMSWRYNGNTITPEKAEVLQAERKPVVAPWSDIGYHFGVENVGGQYVVKTGRPLDKRGAHVGDGGFNIKSIGICAVGNFDKAEPPEEQWWTTIFLVRRLREHYATKNNPIPVVHVLGHREAQAIAGVDKLQRKSCPGDRWNMDKFRECLA